MFIAKTSAGGTVRSLEAHSLDVVSAVRVLLASPVLRARIGVALGQVVDAGVADTLAAVAFIHDAGKADARWQAYVAGGARRDHTAPLLAHLGTTPGLVAALGPILELVDDPEAMLLTVVAHHGAPIPHDIQRLYATEKTDAAAVAETERLVGLARSLWPMAQRITWSPPFSHIFAGVLMLADWIGSAIAFEHGADREALVQRLLTTTGWRAFTAGLDPAAILPSLRPGQQAVLDAPLTDPLLLLEDSTGAGKTEAAVLRALALIDAGRVEGMAFAVPTRSAATELHGRIASIVATVHPDQRGRVMRLVPTALDTDPLLPGQTPSWAVGSTKKAALAPITVGTVDQALLTTMRVRHGWLRRAALTAKLLVIDEVHAGEPYMVRLVEALVRDHLALGGHAMAMSATLGEEAKARLLRRPLRPMEAAAADAYPLRTSTSGSASFAPSISRVVRVAVLSRKQAMSKAVSATKSGARVLWLRSTVREALADRAALRGEGVTTLLHHSRFADQDRKLLDAAVLGAIGKEAPRSGDGMAIVATQTCEQSLDIDADLLVTDACPADVMLQRWGRLHRHQRSRPIGQEVPRVLVLDPGDWERYLVDPRPGAPPPPQGWRWVYPVLSVVATVETLRNTSTVALPADQRRLVEAATHRDSLRALTDRGVSWLQAWQSYVGSAGAERQVADAALADRREQYGESTVEALATRLGDGAVMVATPGLVSPIDGAPVVEIGIPLRWLRGVPPGAAGVVSGRIITVERMRFIYDADGLSRAA